MLPYWIDCRNCPLHAQQGATRNFVCLQHLLISHSVSDGRYQNGLRMLGSLQYRSWGRGDVICHRQPIPARYAAKLGIARAVRVQLFVFS